MYYENGFCQLQVNIFQIINAIFTACETDILTIVSSLTNVKRQLFSN